MDLRFLEAMALRAQAMEVDCADNDNEFPTTQRRRRRVVLLRHFLECASTKHLEMWLTKEAQQSGLDPEVGNVSFQRSRTRSCLRRSSTVYPTMPRLLIE